MLIFPHEKSNKRINFFLRDLRSYLLGDVPVNGEFDEEGEKEDEEEDVADEAEQGEEQAQDLENVGNDEDMENNADYDMRTTLETDENYELLDGERNDTLQPVEQLASLMENLNERVLTPDNTGAVASLKDSFEALEGTSGSDFEARDSLPYLQLRREHQDSDVEMREEERDAETMATDQDNEEEEEDGVVGEDAEEDAEEEVVEEGVDEVVHVMDQEEMVDFGAGLHAAHHAMLNNRQPTHFEPYNRPNIFHFRVSIHTSHLHHLILFFTLFLKKYNLLQFTCILYNSTNHIVYH